MKLKTRASIRSHHVARIDHSSPGLLLTRARICDAARAAGKKRNISYQYKQLLLIIIQRIWQTNIYSNPLNPFSFTIKFITVAMRAAMSSRVVHASCA